MVGTNDNPGMQTQKQIVGRQCRSLKAMPRKLEMMAAEWGDADACNGSELHQLAVKVQEVAESLVPDE